MILKLIYGIFLTSILTFAALTEVDRQEFVQQNILDKYNPGFENGKAKWVNSGGTFALDSSSNIGTGLQSGSFDASATTQTLTSSTVTIPKALYGQSCLARIKYKGGDSNLAFKVLDGSNNVLATQTINANSIYRPLGLAFICPTSGSLKIQIASTANAAIIYLDDAYIGENFQIAEAQVLGDWKQYTLTVGATTTAPTPGTTTWNKAFWRRVGDSMEIRYRIAGDPTAGGVEGSGTYLFPIPSGHTIDTVKVEASTTQIGQTVGTSMSHSGSFALGEGRDGVVSVYNSTNLKLHFEGASTDKYLNLFSSANYNFWADTGASNTYELEFTAKIPIVEFAESSKAYSFDKLGQSWSGYHEGTDCGWSTTSATFVDPAIDSSCTFTERTNRNFGTVTSFNDGTPGNNYPGITFTPTRVGNYFVCATFQLFNSSSNSQSHAQLWDGTTIITSSMYRPGASATVFTTQTLCGVYNATSLSAKSLRVALQTDTGTVNITNNTVGSASEAVEWSIFAIDNEFPAPVIKGVVNSQSETSERIERIKVGTVASPCTSDPCTIASQSGSWVTSVNWISTGRYVVNLASNVFSEAPSCVANIRISASINEICQTTDEPTTSAVYINCGAPNISNANNAFTLICMGPKGSL